MRDQPLRPVVEEVLSLLRSTLPAGVEISRSLADAALEVHADATQLSQVLMNLCTNAWHALGGNAGRIKIGLAEVALDAQAVQQLEGLVPGHYARLSVSDNGCGMEQAMLERIFEPFFTTKGVDQGTGLGLAVVHGIVMSHQGAIKVASEPSKGSTFEVYLPLVAARAPAISSAAPN